MIFIGRGAGDVSKEAQSSVGYSVRERLAIRDVSDFSSGHMAGVRLLRLLKTKTKATTTTKY